MHFKRNSSWKKFKSPLSEPLPPDNSCAQITLSLEPWLFWANSYLTYMKAPWSVSVQWILIGCELKVLKVGRLQGKKWCVCVAAACSSLFSQEGALFIHLRGARWSTAPSLRLSVGLRLQLYVLCPVFVSFSFLSECPLFWSTLPVVISSSCSVPIFYLIHFKTSQNSHLFF